MNRAPGTHRVSVSFIEDYLRLPLLEGDSLHDFYPDTRFVIRAPVSGAPWQEWSEDKRVELARLLEATMERAPFEQGKQILAIRYLPWLGISPELLLLAAFRGDRAGVCRHRNIALAALLLELGAPPSQVRIVSAKQHDWDQGSHLWAEFRASDSGEWQELDGSAAGFGKGRNRALFPVLLAVQCPPAKLENFHRYRWLSCSDRS